MLIEIKKRGQVWIETVIYILIGLALIALILTFVLPRINEEKDKIVIEQTFSSLQTLDKTINTVLERGKDNKRVVEFGMKAGEISFDATNNKIIYTLDGLEKPYSEPDVSIPVGRIVLLTTKGKKTSSVSLTLDYNNFADLTFDESDVLKKFPPTSTPYRFSIENKGSVGGGNVIIDIKEIS